MNELNFAKKGEKNKFQILDQCAMSVALHCTVLEDNRGGKKLTPMGSKGLKIDSNCCLQMSNNA